MSSFGLSSSNEELKLSRKLHTLRKKAAHLTGLHGIISGKGREGYTGLYTPKSAELKEEDLGEIRQRLAAIESARKRVAATDQQLSQVGTSIPKWKRPFARWRKSEDTSLDMNSNVAARDGDNPQSNAMPRSTPTMEEIKAGELKRAKRVKEIDSLIKDGQQRILELQCQKDELQRRPNPLYNYTNSNINQSLDKGKASPEDGSYASDRIFNFPSDALVGEYIEDLQSNGRLLKMNHTQLWKSDPAALDEDEEESIGDDLLTPSGDARKLYEKRRNVNDRRNGASLGGGSWLLRQSLGMGGSLGEKLGVTVEEAAYKGVSSVMMSILARSLASLHGVNVMQHSDIRLFVESTSDLPPVSKAIYSSPSSDYAREAIGKAIRKGSKKKRKRKQKPYHYGSHIGDDTFVQRDAVVETLISHCQISAPLLKLFPAEWQRALLGNIITLITAIVSDFCEGVQFQILGHQLSFSFKPITEADMIQHIGVGGFRFNHRRSKPEEFEAAVRATSDDVSKGLAFLDRWHERALGGDLLKAQIGNLIARVVLTLVDEVLHSARMDLWSAQVGGPRIVAGLEYRMEKT